MYKLIAFDLDGTLLNDNKEVFEENIEIIHKLIEDNVEIIISTGRGYRSCESLVKDISDDIVCICNNGAVGRTLHSYKEIFARYLDPEIAMEVIRLGREFETSPLVHVNNFDKKIDVMYEEFNTRYKPQNRYKNSILNYKEVKEFNSENLEKILALAFFDDLHKTKSLYKGTNNIVNRDFHYHLMENTTLSNSLVEYMGLSVNKWSGIMKYADEKGIEQKEIIVFGDDNNDYEMIKNAGLGIAMKNGTEKVKSVADLITKKDNNKLSISETLNEIFY